jgi:hypothetical protein
VTEVSCLCVPEYASAREVFRISSLFPSIRFCGASTTFRAQAPTANRHTSVLAAPLPLRDIGCVRPISPPATSSSSCNTPVPT